MHNKLFLRVINLYNKWLYTIEINHIFTDTMTTLTKTENFLLTPPNLIIIFLLAVKYEWEWISLASWADQRVKNMLMKWLLLLLLPSITHNPVCGVWYFLQTFFKEVVWRFVSHCVWTFSCEKERERNCCPISYIFICNPSKHQSRAATY